MRYYAEWLDGEYVLLNNHWYDHSTVIQRAMKFCAVFGSTLVLSDVQMIDYRTPIPALFGNSDFRAFLKEKQDFLALAAEPAHGAKDPNFAIAMKGLERLHDQADKPEDSYEMAVTKLAVPIFHKGL